MVSTTGLCYEYEQRVLAFTFSIEPHNTAPGIPLPPIAIIERSELPTAGDVVKYKDCRRQQT